jgi:hypothetical protein
VRHIRRIWYVHFDYHLLLNTCASSFLGDVRIPYSMFGVLYEDEDFHVTLQESFFVFGFRCLLIRRYKIIILKYIPH